MSSCPVQVELYAPTPRPQDHPFLVRQELAALNYYGLRSGDAFLELECGDAGFLDAVARQLGAEGTAVGLEPDVHHLERGRRRIQPLHPDMALLAADPARSGLEDGLFDCCYHRLALHRAPNPLALVREARRVTRRGGMVAVSAVDARWMSAYPASPAMEFAVDEAGPVLEGRGVDMEIGRKLLDLLDEAGLSGLDVQVFSVSTRELGAANWIDVFMDPWLQALPHQQAAFIGERMLDELSAQRTVATAGVFMAFGRA